MNRLGTIFPYFSLNIPILYSLENFKYSRIFLNIPLYKVGAKCIVQYGKIFSLNFVSGTIVPKSFYAQRWNLWSRKVISLSQVNPVIYY